MKGSNPAPHQHAVPILAVDSSGSVAKANAAARKLLSANSDRIDHPELGAFLASLLGSQKGHSNAMLTVNIGGEAHEIMVVLSEGGPESEGRATPPDAGEPSASTQKERLQGEGAVIDFIAHELRNPLSAIIGIAQVLEERFSSVSEEERQEALETIHSEADKALMILQGLLRLAEFRARARVEMANLPLHSVIRNVVTAHVRRNAHRTVTVRGDSPLFAMANSMWVELALSNLLGNAEKYTPRDRRIEVVSYQAGSWATILIFDNGAGLRSDLYHRLWDIYSHGSADGVLVGGSGIGLALCKELIECMGGHVWAGPGRAGGSVFAVSLPSPVDEAVPPLPAPPRDRALVPIS